MEETNTVEAEHIPPDAVELRKPSIPTTINELAALDEKKGLAIIEARSEILNALRVAAIKLTMPNDYVLFKTDEGRISAFLSDSGCDRVKKLFGIQISNLGPMDRIEAKDGTFAYRITADGACGVTGESVFGMEGVRYSDERYALDKPDGIQREVAVQKAARANLDGGITRELAGLKSIPLEELERAWEGSWKKTEMCPRGRGFGSKAERQGAAVQQSEIPPEFQPKCEVCHETMKHIPAGKTAQGKPYSAFWACSKSRDHKPNVTHEQALAEAKRMQAEAGAQRQSGDEQ